MKLFNWDWRKWFVISDILLYQISLYQVFSVLAQIQDWGREEILKLNCTVVNWTS